MDMASGAGAFARNADNPCSLRPHQQHDDVFTFEASLRRFPPMDPFALRRGDGLLELAPDVEPDTGRAAPEETTASGVDLLLYFDEEGLAEWVRPKNWYDWADGRGMVTSRRTFDRALNELMATTRIESRGDGSSRQYQLIETETDVKLD